MQTERRRSKRTRPAGLTYFHFASGTGGIVLNASEEGLGFHAAGVVPRARALRLWISPNPDVQIGLTAEIHWLGLADRLGGLRFMEIPAEARSQLRAWLMAEDSSKRKDLHRGLSSLAAEAAGTHFEAATSVQQLPLPSSGPPAATRRPEIHRPSWIPSPYKFTTAVTAAEASCTPTLPRVFATGLRWNRNLAAGLLVCACVFAPLLCLRHFRLQIGDVFIRFGEELKGASASWSASGLKEPAMGVDPSSRSISSSSRSAANVSPDNSPTRPDLKDAPGDFRKLAFRHKRSAQVAKLWTAVGRGDTSAEVSLAQLYSTGHGVHKNCEQARILLRAAWRSGNAEALRNLQTMRVAGCR